MRKATEPTTYTLRVLWTTKATLSAENYFEAIRQREQGVGAVHDHAASLTPWLTPG